MSSLQRPISAAANARVQQQQQAQAAAAASSSATPANAAAAAKEKALRQDPTLARSFRGHHGAVLSVAYSPVLIRAGDTGLPGYAAANENDSNGASQVGGTVSSRARAQKAATSFVQQLASGGADHVVMLWHLRPQLRAFRFLGHSGPVNCVAFSADGTLLASASDDCTVRVWTPSAEGKSVVLRGHVKRVRSVAWASDKRWLLSTSDDQQCKLWDVESGLAHSHFHGHTQAVLCAAFSPDMRLVATGSADKTVKLFDLQTQSCIQTFYQNTGEVTCVAFHPFGSVLATGCADHSIKLWDIRNNTLLQHYSAHDLGVSSICFHPSGDYLLSTSLAGDIRIWDLRRGHLLYTIHGHPSPVYSAAFNHDGSAFVTGGGDQRVITWNAQLGGGKGNKGKIAGMDSTAGLAKGIGQEELLSASQKRGAMMPSQVARISTHTGALSRNVVEPGRRDAYYEKQGISPTSCPPALPVPASSGPLPPTEMCPQPVAPSSFLAHSAGRRGPPSYTFRTGEHAGQVIGGGGHLYVDHAGGAQASAPPPEGEGTCDYRHSHISSTSGLVHSYAEAHDHALIAEALRRAGEAAEAKYPGGGGGPGMEDQPLEEQLRGFNMPGLTGLAETGRASTRAGRPGPSIVGQAATAGEQEEQQQQAPDTARSQSSFAASAAGVQPNRVHASIAGRSAGSGATDGPSAAGSSTGRQQDDFVYSFQSDRFVRASLHPLQSKTSSVVPLKNSVVGVDIFALPPADHVQRLPEQLAHTLKYVTSQLDQIARAMQVFDYRLNTHEQKVERLEKQQESQ